MRSLAILSLFLSFFAQKCDAVGFAPELYCGMENCYDVLGINREEFDRSTLSKTYRSMAKKHHPDRAKTKDEKELAQQRFRVIATAYETLKEEETKKTYDYYLDHPEERFYNYFAYYRTKAPKVDIRLVILATVLFISTFQFFSAKHKSKEAIEYACSVGKYRNMAIKDGVDKGRLEMDRNGKLKKTKGSDNEAIIRQIIIENLDIAGGYKKESIYDTFAWHIIVFPLTVFNYIKWCFVWYWRFSLKGEEYDEEAKLYLIRKHMGMRQNEFDQRFTDADIDEMLERECWNKAECLQYKAEREAAEQEKMAQSGRYKRYKRYMKNAGTISFVDED